MDRKESIKTMLLGAVSLPFFKNQELENGDSIQEEKPADPMRSRWEEWPDMEWTGPEFWANRLQDWKIRDGKALCSISGPNRSLHCLTHQLREEPSRIFIRVDTELLNQSRSADDYVGIRLGAQAKDDPCPVTFTDYRRAAVFGEGLNVGVTADGHLFVGSNKSKSSIDFSGAVRLEVEAEPRGKVYRVMLTVVDRKSGRRLDRLSTDDIVSEALVGNLALISHFQSREDGGDEPSARFSDWRIEGSKLTGDPAQVFGPICFAQYTLDQELLKMTAQLTPVERVEGHNVELQIREAGRWQTVQQTIVHPLARTAHFRLEEWNRAEDTPYRIKLKLPLSERTEEYYYEGTIAADPVESEELKMAVFSCNSHYGFPNAEVVQNVTKHRPDMAVFLGDQIYESHGGFGVERTRDVEKAALDFLRKWYMFGWSYRTLFRDIPSAFLPDDHDVFHGNIWGEGGKAAPTDEGWGYKAQDKGGYKYPGEWVRVVERVLTDHLPDPWDPTPIGQNISVYYTDWTYGGVSLAIIEDRKFKTAPDNALPFEVVNGFPQDPDVDLSRYYDTDADLLGERQHQFLEQWAGDWSHGAKLKAVLSQSPFCGAHSMSKGSTHDRGVPRRSIPARGQYPSGDYPARDMDSNGWPQKGRDEALRIMRKGFALHIAGDQHLGSVLQYGVEEYGDAGFVFTGPALNNVWPRRWCPTVDEGHRPLLGRPKYTGNFKDAFGNRITVLAAANPVQTNREPALIYDRATGYGIVTFNKADRTTRIECWPRYVDPQANPEGQYDGWPVIIRQRENYGRSAVAQLPEVRVEGLQDPVIEIYNEASGNLEYALRIKGSLFTPKVFDREASYKVRIGDPDRDLWREYDNVRPGKEDQKIKCTFT